MSMKSWINSNEANLLWYFELDTRDFYISHPAVKWKFKNERKKVYLNILLVPLYCWLIKRLNLKKEKYLARGDLYLRPARTQSLNKNFVCSSFCDLVSLTATTNREKLDGCNSASMPTTDNTGTGKAGRRYKIEQKTQLSYSKKV